MRVFNSHGKDPSGRTSLAKVSWSKNRAGSYLWLGDVTRCLMQNLSQAGEAVALITVTAPGSQFLPWACSQDHVHSGKLGCKASESHAREWNASAQRRWSALHRAASQSVRRQLGRGFPLLAIEWQMQARGVLHVHVVGSWETELDRIGVKLYVAELRRLTASHGFGYVDFRDRAGKTGKPSVMAAHRAGSYLSRYLGESSQLLEAVQAKHRPRRLVYITPKLTTRTGCTMRNLRRVRYLHVIRSGRSSVIALAGTLPAWFKDRSQLAVIEALYRPPLVE